MNKDLAGFIASTQKKAIENIKSNQTVAWDSPSMHINRDVKAADPSQRVPMAAQSINDDEKLTKELMDLKDKLREVFS